MNWSPMSKSTSVWFQLVAKLDSLLLRLTQNDYSVLLKRHLATPRTGPDTHLRPIGRHLQLKHARTQVPHDFPPLCSLAPPSSGRDSISNIFPSFRHCLSPSNGSRKALLHDMVIFPSSSIRRQISPADQHLWDCMVTFANHATIQNRSWFHIFFSQINQLR
jgi:hypothetical protein